MIIREYVIVQNKYKHPKLEELNSYDWDGDLIYVDEIHRLLTEVFRMNRLNSEASYVIAFDHAKKIKGVCQIGCGNANEVAMPMQNIFSFLMLVGANSFIVSHNHISNMPNPSLEDNIVTTKISMLANMFDIEFIGHMIINPNGYVVDGGVMGERTNYNESNIETKTEIEYLGKGMAATYIFGNRIEGKIEDIKKIIGYDEDEEDN